MPFKRPSRSALHFVTRLHWGVALIPDRFNGKSGTGFSVVTTDPQYIETVPDILEKMARDMRAASKAQKN